MSDGRITNFVNAEAIKQDKKIIIDALNEVLTTIETINTTKMQIFGAANIKDVSKALTELSNSYKTLHAAQAKAAEVAIKEERVRTQAAETALRQSKQNLENAKAKVEEAKARDKNAAAIEREERAERNRKAAATGQSSGASPTRIFSNRDINTLKTDIAFLESKISALRDKMKSIGTSEVAMNSPEFLQAAKAVNHYTGQLAHAEKQLARLSEAEQIRQSIRRQDGKAEAAFKKEVEEAEKLNSAYIGLTETLRKLQTEIQELGAKQYLGTITNQEKDKLGDLQLQAADLSRAIGKIDQAAARSGVNSAAYARQLFSLQQVLRETPSIAYGASTFLSAIANNIPILADDLKRITDENKRLAQSGKPVESVGQAIARSFFSWQTVILALVSVLAIFGTQIFEWTKNLFKSDEALRRAYLNSKQYLVIQEKLNKVIQSLTDSYSKLNSLQNRTNNDAVSKLQSQLRVMEALGVSAEKLFGFKEKIAKLELSSAAETQTSTADQIASQFRLMGRTIAPMKNQQLSELDKTIQTREGQLSRRGTYGLSPGANDRLSENVTFLKESRELKRQEIENNKDAEKEAERFVKEKMKIEKDYQEGRLTEHQKTNALIIAEDQFLVNATAITKRAETIATQRKSLIEVENARQLAFDQKLKRDPEKDKNGVVQNEKNIETASKDADLAKSLNEQVTDASTKTREAIERDEALKNEKRKFYADEARKIALASAQSEVDIALTKNQSILNNERSTLDQKLNALEQIRQASIRGAAAQLADVENDIGASPADKIAAHQRFKSEEFAIQKNYEDERRELIDSYNERNRTAQKEARDSERKLFIDSNEEITNNILANLQDRLDAEKNAFEQRKQLAEDEYRLTLRNAGMSDAQIDAMEKDRSIILNGFKLTNDEIRSLQVQRDNELVSLTRETTRTITEIWADELEKQEDLHEDFIEEISRLYKALGTEQTENYTEDLAALNDQLAKKLISYRKYVQERNRLDAGAETNDLNLRKNELQSKRNAEPIKNAETNFRTNEKLVMEIEAQLLLPGLSPEQKADLLDQLTFAKKLFETSKKHLDEKLDIDRELAEVNKQLAENFAALAEEEANRLEEAYSNAFAALRAFGESLVNAGFEKRATLLEKELELLERKSQREREIIEQTVTNEEEKNKRLKLLEDRRQAQQDIIERKKRQLEIRRAQAQKTSSLMDIGIALAKTIAEIKFRAGLLASYPATAPLVPMALAQIPIAIATAALQSAAVIAQPIPKYKDGTLDHIGGAAIVGDGGKSELVVTPDGDLIRTPSVPTLMHLPMHSIVYPDAEAFTRNAVKAKTDLALSVAARPDELNATMKQGFASLNKTIRNKPEIILRKGMTTDLLMRYGKDYWKYL